MKCMNKVIITTNKLFVFIFLLIVPKLKTGERNMLNSLFSNIITLTIKGPGKQYIFCKDNSEGYSYGGKYPSKIILNGQEYSKNISNIIELEENISTIQMFWDINILSYSSMFYGCENILEADLTQINITSAANFKNLFSDCKSLKKVKLFKINSNEDNYNVNLNYMFSNCSSLNFVNISDIQLNGKNNDLNMYYTFKGCISLNSVSIFNILLNGYGNRGDMRDIFGDCPSLKSVNIFNIELNG